MRRLGILVSVLSALVLPSASAAPAYASGDGAVCTGTWRLKAVGDYTLLLSRRNGFTMTPDTADCTPDHSATAVGELNGVCFGATGGGTIDGAHGFTVQWRGANLVFSGGVVGTLAITADAAASDRCIGGSADDFVLAGTLHIVD